MPRRSSTRISTSAAVVHEVPQLQVPLDPVSENFKNLRQHWKWAAFCQFFYVFFDLFNINDVSVEDIENDLIHDTDVFLPRVMQRLLFTLSYDRKISLDNWQNALRRQYDRRNPEANPLGSPSTVQTATNSRHTSVFKDEGEELDPEDQQNKENGVGEEDEDQKPKDTTETAFEDEETAPVESAKASERAASTAVERVTVDWSQLSMDQKLESLHTLIEWQFQNPLRLRQLMKTDDEGATWRSEPVGYDKETNAYWLMGGNRLWIQRAPPKPPTRKRKRKAEPEPKSRSAAKGGSSKRQRTSKSQTSTKSKPKGKAAPKAKEPPPTPTTGRSSRAAKEQAKVKLDAQAKALEEFKRETAAASAPTASTSGRATRSRQVASKPAPAPTPARQTAGTRISARLRGVQQDDEWQKIPDEWLDEDKKNGKTGLESDSEASELTELTEDGDEEEQNEEEPEEAEQREEEHEKEEEQIPPQADFVEWETLCVSLAEWEAFPERFAKSTYYAEKAFYKILTTVIVPEVVAELRAIEQKRRLEEALSHRKRSSRLATREHEKEAAKVAAQERAEEEEKMSRTRRLEARQQREEAERLKKEKAREERRLKRETRTVEQENEETPEMEEEEEEKPPEPQQPEQRPKRGATKREHDTSHAKSEPKKRVRSQSKKTAGSKATDDWELNCEVCGMTGKNLDDGKPMMCCGRCNKWQHIPCHDSRDARMGRPKRDWNKIEFFCARCLAMKVNGAHNAHPSHHSSSSHRYQQNYAPGTNGASHLSQLPYGQAAGQQSSWQPPAVSYNLKPAASATQGYPEPSAYAQSYLAPTSSVRSSTYGHPTHSGQAQHAAASVHGQGYGSHGQGYGATAYGGGNISFSHYQPQERVFTNEAERAAQHGQQSSYYRMNGHTGYAYQHQQAYPSQQPGWSGAGGHHYSGLAQASYPASSSAPIAHRPATYDNPSAQRSTYDALAREAQAYRQQPTPPASVPVQGQAPIPAAVAPPTNGHYDRGPPVYPPPAA